MDWKTVLEFMDAGWELRQDLSTGKFGLLYPPNWNSRRVHGNTVKALLRRGLIEEWRRGVEIVVYGRFLSKGNESNPDG